MLAGPVTRPSSESTAFYNWNEHRTMISIYIEGRRNLWIEW